jgi:hypothetical protein
VGRLLSTPLAEYSRAVRLLTRLGIAGIAVAFGSLGLLLIPAWRFAHWAELPPVPARFFVALSGLACAAAIVFAVTRFRASGRAVALSATAAFAMGYVYLIALPAAEPYRWQRPFAAQVHSLVGTDSDGLALYRTREMVYYLNVPQDLADFESEPALREAVLDRRVRWLLVAERDLRALNLPATVVARAPVHSWDKGAVSGSQTILARFDPQKVEGGGP